MLQLALMMMRPEAGALISGSGGLRKLRWSVPGKGKSSGLRIIYYLFEGEKIYLLFVYKKSESVDLTKKQLKQLQKYLKGGVL